MDDLKLKELLDVAQENLKPLADPENPDIRLEEVEYLENIKEWDIVASYLTKNTNKKSNSAIGFSIEFPYERIYKKIKMNNEKKITGIYIYKP